jgi:hypothetical protein
MNGNVNTVNSFHSLIIRCYSIYEPLVFINELKGY